MSDRHTLLKEINEVSFAINDVTLYLDTHPTDQNALNYFNEMLQRRKTAMKEYETQFEPLVIDCVNPAENNSSGTETKFPGTMHWTWADGPVPWEGGHI